MGPARGVGTPFPAGRSGRSARAGCRVGLTHAASSAFSQRRFTPRKRHRCRPRSGHVTRQAPLPGSRALPPASARAHPAAVIRKLGTRSLRCGQGRGSHSLDGTADPAAAAAGSRPCSAPPRPAPRSSAPHPFLRPRLPAGASPGQVRRERFAGPGSGRRCAASRYAASRYAAASGPGASGAGGERGGRSGSGQVGARVRRRSRRRGIAGTARGAGRSGRSGAGEIPQA